VVERPERRAVRGDLVLVRLIVVRHRRTVLVRQHGEHAFDALCGARVDARDAPLGDRRADDARMREAGSVELRGILGGTGDLGDAVDAGCGGADVACHGLAHAIFLLDCDCGVPRAACDSARTIARRARSILNVLCPKPLASRSTRSAAWANVASPAGL